MERLNAENNKGEGLLERMNSFLSESVLTSAGGPEDPKDDVLPFESLEDYSTDPISFEELADMVNTKVKYFFSLSAKYNHRSSEYLEVCGFLERGIKYLGSCCLSAVLLKQKGHELSKLEDLSTHWLYGMVSFNIRKLNRTVDEELSHSGTIPSKWLDMQFRYINLAERLKSTETKIYEFANYYWLDSDKYVKRALMFSEKAYNRNLVEKHVKKPDFRMPPSFPAVKIENKKSEIRNQDSGSGTRAVSLWGEASAPHTVSAGTVREDTTRCRKELSPETPESGNMSTQYAVPGTQQSAAGDNGDCAIENKKSETKNKKSIAGGKHPASIDNGDRSHLNEDTDPADDTRQNSKTKGGDDVIPNSELRIPHSVEPVPAFMAILESAAERNKDKEEGGICLTFEELDALASDPEFREFDPDLAEVIRRKHAEIFPGIGSP